MNAASSARAHPAVTRPNAVSVGTMVWLASELMFFAGLFAMYFSIRAVSPDLWASSTEMLRVPFAAGNTLVLVVSSITCQMGVFAAERFQPRLAGPLWDPRGWGMTQWFVLTYILGAIFIAGQVYEYVELVREGLSISTNAYGSVFFLTTGFHGLHVLGGLIAFILVIGRGLAARTFGAHEATSAVVVSYYWHFVDVVWIGLFFTIYVLQ